MAFVDCYMVIYDGSTSAFIKHGNSTSAVQLSANSGVSALHDCGFYVDTTSAVEVSASPNIIFNLSADSIFGVTSANTDLATAITSGESQTSGTPVISASVGLDGELDMKIELEIEILTPIIQTVYEPLEKTKPSEVVRKENG